MDTATKRKEQRGGDPHVRTEVRDGMQITWNQPITMSDGVTLRADIFRPVADLPMPRLTL